MPTIRFVGSCFSLLAEIPDGIWLVFERGNDSLVSFAGFLRSEEGTPSLIYGVHPDRWGCDYATEAASAVLSYALENLALPKVRADVDEPNIASVRVLEKLGMRRTGREVVNGHPLLYFEKVRSALPFGFSNGVRSSASLSEEMD